MKSYLLHELTSFNIKEILRKRKETIAIFCLGSIEQHGSHLPLGTDILSVQDRALKIAKKTNSIVCVTTLAGYSPQHKKFEGTISFSQETLRGIIFDTIVSLKSHGFKRILILNAHTTNASIIESTILKIKEIHNISIAFARNFPKKFLDVFQNRKYKSLDIHAGLSETSVMKAICPDLVDNKFIDNYVSSNKFQFFDEMNKKKEIDEIDQFLFETLMPAKTEEISENGIYGTSDIKQANAKLYLNNVDKTIQFYVDFIKRWEKVNV